MYKHIFIKEYGKVQMYEVSCHGDYYLAKIASDHWVILPESYCSVRYISKSEKKRYLQEHKGERKW